MGSNGEVLLNFAMNSDSVNTIISSTTDFAEIVLDNSLEFNQTVPYQPQDSDVEMVSVRSDAVSKANDKSDAKLDGESILESGAKLQATPEEVFARKGCLKRTMECPAPPNPTPKKRDWKINLRILISNLYIKSENRLPGACVSRCLYNTSLCTQRHRCSALPDGPNFSAVQALRTTLHGQHYDTFLDILEMMVMQGVYPGEGVFDRLIDMAMILIAKEISVKELGDIYNKLIRIFFLLVDAFPPCWTALRPYYLSFLGVSNPALRATRSTDSTQKLQFYIDLLEENLMHCSDEEIRENTKFYEKFVFNFSEEEDANMSQETVFLRHVQQYDWQSGKLCLDDFKRMSPAVRLARVCDVLNMLTWVLEMEFLSWLDHNRLRQSESEMFQENSRSFAWIVFGMSAGTRLTDIVKQIMRLYGQAVAKSMYPERQRILQVESVNLALKILDEYNLRGHKIRVQRAQFQMRGEYNPALKPKRKKKDKEKLQKMKEKLFDWRPDKMRGERSKNEKTVIIKNLFTPELFEKEVELILEYQNNLREECSKCGMVRKVVIYDRHPEGVAQINMASPEEADLVIQMMQGRFFGQRQLSAESWDGKTKYKIDESAVEAHERLSKWDEFLAEEETDKKASEEKKEEDVDSPETQLLPGDATP
ncbi:GM22141 [Drosophila sechellia]|uniref:GM22141 n=1 Tax=Drosophila sechellia TaxID=7238 RepID=B4IAP3_DROSE|nr:GM22141 [Drosophila sechellia]